MYLTFGTILRRIANRIQHDLIAPLKGLAQSLLFLQTEMAKEDFSHQVTEDILHGKAPFREHLDRFQINLNRFINKKHELVPEMEGKGRLLEDAEKLGQEIIEGFDRLEEENDVIKKVDQLQKLCDTLSDKLIEITSVLLPKVEHVREPELMTFRRASSLLIDDLWDPKELGLTEEQTARTSDEALKKLKEHTWDKIYLDNDLGSGQREGWQILDWILRNLPNESWPHKVVIFTQNNQALKTMESKLRSTGYMLSGQDHGHPLWMRSLN